MLFESGYFVPESAAGVLFPEARKVHSNGLRRAKRQLMTSVASVFCKSGVAEFILGRSAHRYRRSTPPEGVLALPGRAAFSPGSDRSHRPSRRRFGRCNRSFSWLRRGDRRPPIPSAAIHLTTTHMMSITLCRWVLLLWKKTRRRQSLAAGDQLMTMPSMGAFAEFSCRW